MIFQIASILATEVLTLLKKEILASRETEREREKKPTKTIIYLLPQKKTLTYVGGKD